MMSAYEGSVKEPTERRYTLHLVLLLVAVLAIQCAPAQAPTGTDSPRSEGQSAAPKRLVAAIRGNPASVSNVLNAGGGGRIDGAVEMSGLTSSGFAVQGQRGQWLPVLAEQLPSLQNGTWTLLPDGRMETSWTIKKGALWHDGAPLTSQDVIFTTTMLRDASMPWIVDPVYRYIESVQAVDDRTVKVIWNQAYIRADQLPMNPVFPGHLLEERYQSDKENVVNLPFWTSDFVGTGPFRVRGFVRDSHLDLVAFDGYVLGRPKLDELEVRFIADHPGWHGADDARPRHVPGAGHPGPGPLGRGQDVCGWEFRAQHE
jgi:ABC-type transport system substrate-binding protein